MIETIQNQGGVYNSTIFEEPNTFTTIQPRIRNNPICETTCKNQLNISFFLMLQTEKQ